MLMSCLAVLAVLLTVQRAAEITTLSPWTIRKLLATGKLPFVKLGRRVAIHPDALHEFIEAGRTHDADKQVASVPPGYSKTRKRA